MAARTQHQRVDQQDELVDEVASHQRPNQHAAAEHHQVLIQFLFEPVAARVRVGRDGGKGLVDYGVALGRRWAA